ncbi:MAG: cupin domain-containing protein [Pigmentiphaga sp.]|nr:cupin domain-containing protein [Pigmentiphaga sp.]
MTQHGGDTIHCDALPWLPLAPQVFVKIIKLVPETGAFSVMIRAEPGGVLPRHKHLESAEIFILKGEGEHKQTGPFRPGDYVSERKGAVHDALPFHQETELLMVCNGPSAFLGPNDETLYLMDVPMLQQLAAAAPGSPAY